jgi:putative transposase
LCAQPIEMPHYGSRRYSPKTLRNWLGEYRRHGFDALKPGSRSDRGKSRKITPEMEDRIREKIEQFPRAKASVLYDELVDDGVFSPANSLGSVIDLFASRVSSISSQACSARAG